MRVALGLEYDGTAFCGWQTQPGGCGVQDAVETAVSAIASQPVNTVCAGRTDSGVHALCQVVHFDSPTQRPLNAWVRGVNSELCHGVSVLWAREVGGEFHARYSATARRYKYVLLNRPQRPALFSSHVGWFHARLDEGLMQSAAVYLVGEHDFSAFRAAECQAKNPVRVIREISIIRSGNIIVFDITANAFLHHMVRNIVGSLIYVGCRRQQPGWIHEILQGRDRTHAAPTFSANGLYLCRVEYPQQWNLPGRTEDSFDRLLSKLKD